MKQTFNIPDGCKTISVEQVGNQIITSFEPEKYVPKAGDCIKFGDGFAECLSNPKASNDGDGIDIMFGHWKPKTQDYIVFEKQVVLCETDYLQKLTPEEFQAEFDKLGYVYDFETHTARKKRKRVEVGGRYFYSDKFFESDDQIEDSDDVDDMLYEAGNYFTTESECQKYCDYMKECSLKYFDK